MAAILRLTTGVVYVRSISGTLTFASGSTAQFADGSASAPSIAFSGTSSDTGLYLVTTDIIGITTAGVVMSRFDSSGFGLSATSFLGWGSSGINSQDLFLYRDAANTLTQRNGTNAQTFNLGAAGAATATFSLNGAASAISATKTIKKVTGIADAAATDVITVTVPNANHAAGIKLTFLSSNGSTDAFESSRVAEGLVVVARTTGVATVAVVAALDLAQIATVGGGATHTLAYGVSAMAGTVGATQTFTIQVTLNDTGNLGSNQVVVVAEVVNAETAGVTIA